MSVGTFHKHFHQRHKKRPKKEPIDILIYLAVFAGPLFTIPQVYEVWFNESAGVAMLSWAAYAVIAALWLVYGIKHDEKPIIVSQIFWLVMDMLIVTGLMLSR